MKLYHIRNATNIEQIGSHPQLEFSNKRNGNYSIDADYSVSKIARGGVVESHIKFPVLETTKYGKLTDYMSYSGPGSGELNIFSNNIKFRVTNLQIDDFETHPIQVFHQNQSLQYQSVHFLHIRDIIDWSNSVFSIVPKEGYTFEGQHQIWNELSEIRFESKDSYLKWRRENRETDVTVIKKHLALNTVQWDVFRVSSLVFGVLCTDKFVDWIKNQGFTGFDFEAVQLDFREAFVADIVK